VTVEGGDRAYYKVVSTKTFTISVAGTDNSAPSTANKVPSGFTADPLPEISCKLFDNQSGIDLNSIVMKVDGVVAVSSANISMAWDARNQRVFYRPQTPFPPSSSHSVEISANHWADDPADKKNVTETWNFNVNY
jgi:hypothetical protein